MTRGKLILTEKVKQWTITIYEGYDYILYGYVVGDWYADSFIKYDKNIYFKGEILESADYNTFEVLPNGDGKDKGFRS